MTIISNYIIYIINVESPNLELQPQGISYQERERDSVQRCQIKQDFRVAKKAKSSLTYKSAGGGGANTCKAGVAQLVSYIKYLSPSDLIKLLNKISNMLYIVFGKHLFYLQCP